MFSCFYDYVGDPADRRGMTACSQLTEWRGVIVAASLPTASAQQPERTEVREDCAHCPAVKWQVK
jgi:hypothetical protein